MFSEIGVYTDVIGGSAQQILGTGKALAAEVTSFRGQADALTDAFGGDDLGSALGMIYQVISEAAFESFADNINGLSEIGRNLQHMAEDYAAVDSVNGDVFENLLEDLR